MAIEEIWIGEGDVRRKLEGKELEDFLAMRQEMAATSKAENDAIEAKAAAKASAIVKLAALGLTEAEANAIVS